MQGMGDRSKYFSGPLSTNLRTRAKVSIAYNDSRPFCSSNKLSIRMIQLIITNYSTSAFIVLSGYIAGLISLYFDSLQVQSFEEQNLNL